jgi:hypothetical protein
MFKPPSQQLRLCHSKRRFLRALIAALAALVPGVGKWLETGLEGKLVDFQHKTAESRAVNVMPLETCALGACRILARSRLPQIAEEDCFLF